MIRYTIQRKVFFATFALATVMALLLIGLTRWNLEKGFSRYVVETEIGRMDWLVRHIENAYAKNGNWDFLQGHSEPWDRIIDREAHTGRRLPPPPPPGLLSRLPLPPFAEGAMRPPGPPGPPGSPNAGGGPPPDVLGILPRLSVRDPAGNVVAGNPQPDGLSARRPILHRGETVGHLTLQAPGTEAARDAAFLATQTRDLWLSGFAALALSLIAAWLLARQFLAPIRDLSLGARQIAEGRLSERIPVRQNDELGQLASDFNTMADTLARTEESRRQWVSDSSHELRTPIAVLRAEIEALQDGVRHSDEKTLGRLHKHVMQMSKLVDDLRQTLDTESGQADLERVLIDPLPVLCETLDEFRARFALADVALDRSDLPQSNPGWRILGDADRLQQVFANLLENTLRYTHPGGRLKLSSSARGGRLHLKFEDTLPAPPEHALPRLFERFFRAEPSRSRQHGGSGLGLAICKSIVEGHDGSITASKSSLGGLCIHIDLPLER